MCPSDLFQRDKFAPDYRTHMDKSPGRRRGRGPPLAEVIRPLSGPPPRSGFYHWYVWGFGGRFGAEHQILSTEPCLYVFIIGPAINISAYQANQPTVPFYFSFLSLSVPAGGQSSRSSQPPAGHLFRWR